MTTTIKEPIRRTLAYWYVDGLVEMGMGLIFFLLGIVLILESKTPSGSTQASLLSFFRNAILIRRQNRDRITGQSNKNTFDFSTNWLYRLPTSKREKILLGIGLVFGAVISGGLVLILIFMPFKR